MSNERQPAAAPRPDGRTPPAAWAALADENRFWSLMCFVVAAVAVFKGAHLPNLWSATQAQIDYSQGLVKRGLFGAVAHWLGVPIGHYSVFAAVSVAILAAFLAALGFFLARSPLARSAAGKTLLAVYLSSVSLTYFAHCVGYFDVLLAIFPLVVASRRRWGAGFAAAAALAAVGVLVHELYLVAFLPVSLLGLLLDAIEAPPALRRRRLAALAGLCLGAVGLACVVSIGAPLAGESLTNLIEQVRSQADFEPQPNYFEVMNRSLVDCLWEVRTIWTTAFFWGQLLPNLLLLLPAEALFFAVGRRLLRRRLDGPWLKAAAGATIVVVASPLLLYVIGRDHTRWSAWASYCGLLARAIVAARSPGADAGPPVSMPERRLCLLLMSLNMAAGAYTLDGAKLAHYPFVEGLGEVARWLASLWARH